MAGVVALVRCASGAGSVQDALEARIQALGARVVPRLNKDVTHVVFQRQASVTREGRAAEDQELRALHDRVRRVSIVCVARTGRQKGQPDVVTDIITHGAGGQARSCGVGSLGPGLR